MINMLSARAFNEVWFRKAPARPRRHIAGIKPFFFPLDGVRGWNRIYGTQGFVQYQFVVPVRRRNTSCASRSSDSAPRACRRSSRC